MVAKQIKDNLELANRFYSIGEYETCTLHVKRVLNIAVEQQIGYDRKVLKGLLDKCYNPLNTNELRSLIKSCENLYDYIVTELYN